MSRLRNLTSSLLISLYACQAGGPTSDLFEKGHSLGTNKNDKLEEASGLVASVKNPGMLWTLNDSGNPAELFLLDTLAQTKKVFSLPGLKNRDWEDLALGFNDDNTPCLYIGDIGDNSGQYLFKYIYRIHEPSIDDPEEINTVDKLTIRMEDGARDTETLLSDPYTKSLFLVSKREDKVGFYEIRGAFKGDTVTAKKVATLDLREIVAGDISPDGTEVLLKSYTFIYYWKRTSREPLAELLTTTPARLAYHHEPQGESIAWSRDASCYYTISENAGGERGELIRYKRK